MKFPRFITKNALLARSEILLTHGGQTRGARPNVPLSFRADQMIGAASKKRVLQKVRLLR